MVRCNSGEKLRALTGNGENAPASGYLLRISENKHKHKHAQKMNYQDNLFGPPERSFTWDQLVHHHASNTPPTQYTKEDWRREVVSKCLVDSPTFSTMVQRLSDAFRRGGKDLASTHARAAFVDYLFSNDCPSTETINRTLRKWTQVHQPQFKTDEPVPQYSRALR